MNAKRVLASAFTAATILSAYATLTAEAPDIPPLPGQLAVQTFADAGGCTDHVRLSYRAKTVDTVVGFAAEILSNCTTIIKKHEYGSATQYQYAGGYSLEHHFEEDFYGGGCGPCDNHFVAISGAWPAINSDAPCAATTSRVWSASSANISGGADWNDLTHPPTHTWDPVQSDGICTEFVTTTWTPVAASNAPAYTTVMTIDTLGVATCDTAATPYYPNAYPTELGCLPFGANVVFQRVSAEDIIGWITSGGGGTFTIHV